MSKTMKLDHHLMRIVKTNEITIFKKSQLDEICLHRSKIQSKIDDNFAFTQFAIANSFN